VPFWQHDLDLARPGQVVCRHLQSQTAWQAQLHAQVHDMPQGQGGEGLRNLTYPIQGFEPRMLYRVGISRSAVAALTDMS
jgi:hypothetical protein